MAVEYMNDEKIEKLGYKRGKGFWYKKTLLGGFDIFIRCMSCQRYNAKPYRTNEPTGSQINIICEICRDGENFTRNGLMIPRQTFKIINKEK